jgi:hypothetical protein
MGKKRDIFKQFNESFMNMDGQVHVLEHQVPVEQQMEYFRFSNKVRQEIKDVENIDIEGYIYELTSSEYTNEYKKKILSILAASKQVKAYRFLENYVHETESELTNWANMALMESRIMLDFEFSGERQIYISTGLGGKGEKLRFYALVVSSLKDSFAEYQQKIINNEFRFALPKKECDLEKLTISKNYVEILALVPLQINLKNILDEIIAECNQYGNFLREVYAITNVKEFDEREIADIIKKYEATVAGI